MTLENFAGTRNFFSVPGHLNQNQEDDFVKCAKHINDQLWDIIDPLVMLQLPTEIDELVMDALLRLCDLAGYKPIKSWTAYGQSHILFKLI